MSFTHRLRTSPSRGPLLALLALLVAVISGVASLGCAEPTPPPPPQPTRLRVTTTSYPVDYLVARIGGDAVRRRHILPAGQDPPDYQPPPDVISSLADEELVAASGAGYEAWMKTAAVPRGNLVEASKPIRLIQLEDDVTHSHGGGDHTHAGADPHTWSDPTEFRAMAREIRDALVRADPSRRTHYDAGFSALDQDLRRLVTALDGVRQAATGEVHLAANHPAYNYLMRRLAREVKSFHLPPSGPAPGDEVAKVKAWAQAHAGRRVMLWEEAPSDDVKAALPPALEHVVLDPLEQPDAGGAYDYVTRLAQNIEVLRRVLTVPAPLSDGP